MLEVARRDLDTLRPMLSVETIKEKLVVLDTLDSLITAKERVGPVTDVLIEMGFNEFRQGLAENPDRLARAYRIAERARDIELMAQQLQNAEAIFESEELSDDDLETIEVGLGHAQASMEDPESMHGCNPNQYGWCNRHDHHEGQLRKR